VTLDYTRDTDPVETKEWLDSLEGVIEVEGPERAHFLLNRVMEGAREKGAPVPYSANTPYLNTIPVEKQPLQSSSSSRSS
jgi:pyruvate dehydrogenase E1 component